MGAVAVSGAAAAAAGDPETSFPMDERRLEGAGRGGRAGDRGDFGTEAIGNK